MTAAAGWAGRTRSVGFIILAQIAAMTLWFSASAIVPNLLATGQITAPFGSLLTGAVQLGFVAGTLASAVLGLPDRLDPRLLFASAALVGALANAAIVWVGFSPSTLALRFVTGAALAGVYPVGMKLAAGWAGGHMGAMIGALVGALTLGSALPHLFGAVASLDWRVTVAASSALAVVAAACIGLVRLGPGHGGATAFRPGDSLRAFRRPAVRLVMLGYLGHMWELYAMWAWIGPFMAWSYGELGLARATGPVVFGIVAAGSVGCLAGGVLADRIGRTLVTGGAMVVSGACALAIGPSVALGLGPLLAVAFVWGTAIVADSAQFSAGLAELSDRDLVGTTLTLQTCLGFLLTFVSVQLLAPAVDLVGWRYAFCFLAIGPALGALAMGRLRADPDAVLMAGGRR